MNFFFSFKKIMALVVIVCQIVQITCLSRVAYGQIRLRDGSTLDLVSSGGEQNLTIQQLRNFYVAVRELSEVPNLRTLNSVLLPSSLDFVGRYARSQDQTTQVVAQVASQVDASESERNSLMAHLMVKLKDYQWLHHNRLMAASTMASEIASMGNRHEDEQLIFSAIQDIVPEVNAEEDVQNVAASRSNVVVDADYFMGDGAGVPVVKRNLARIMAARGMEASRHGLTLVQFKDALALENILQIWRSYWYLKTLYGSAFQISNIRSLVIPNSLPMGRPGLTAQQWLDGVRTQAVSDARQMLSVWNTGSQPTPPRIGLLSELERSRKLIYLSHKAHLVARQSNEAQTMLAMKRAIDNALHLARWGSLPPSEANAQTESLATVLRVVAGTRVGANYCGTGPNRGKLVIPSFIALGGRSQLYVHEVLRQFFENIFPGRGQSLLNELLSAASSRPLSVAPTAELGDGCGDREHPIGYNRTKWFKDFLEVVYEARFPGGGYQRASGLATWEKTKLEQLSKQPLLMTNILKDSFNAETNMTDQPITEAQVREAFVEQVDRMRDVLAELTIIANASRSQRQDRSNGQAQALAQATELLARNPVAAWRLVAKDWRYFEALNRAYVHSQTLDENLQQRRNHYIVAGVVVGAGLSLASLGVGSWVGGVVGGKLILFGSALGASLGAYELWHSLQDVGFFSQRSEFIRTQVMSRAFNSLFNRQMTPAQATVAFAELHQFEVALEQYSSAYMRACLNGVLMLVDGAFLAEGIATVRQIQAARELLVRTGPLGTVVAGDEIQVGLLLRRRMNVLGLFERRANVQSTRVNEIFEANRNRDIDVWWRELSQNQNVTVEELLAYAVKRFQSLAFQRQLGQLFQSGRTVGTSDVSRLSRTVAVNLSKTRLGKRLIGSPEAVGNLVLEFGMPWGRSAGTVTGNTLRGVNLQSAEDVNRFFGKFFQYLEETVFADATVLDYVRSLGRGVGRGVQQELLASGRSGQNRPFSQWLRDVLSHIENPQELINRERQGVLAALRSDSQLASSIDPEFMQILAEGRLVAPGSWGAALERRILAAGNASAQEAKRRAFSESFWAIWKGFWGGIGLYLGSAGLYDISSRWGGLANEVNTATGFLDLPQSVSSVRMALYRRAAALEMHGEDLRSRRIRNAQSDPSEGAYIQGQYNTLDALLTMCQSGENSLSVFQRQILFGSESSLNGDKVRSMDQRCRSDEFFRSSQVDNIRREMLRFRPADQS